MYLKYMQNKQLLKNIDLHIKILQRQKKYLIETASKFSLEIINCINQKGKILIAGNGGSASDAQHFSTELTVKMSKIRKALPFISLSTDTSAITAIVMILTLIKFLVGRLRPLDSQMIFLSQFQLVEIQKILLMQ